MCNLNYSAGILILNENNQILFIKKIENGLRSCLGGKQEKGENSISCAIRELKEETGLENVELNFLTYSSTINNGKKWIETMYVGKIKNKSKITIEDHLYSEYKFYDLNRLPSYLEMENHTANLIKAYKGEKEIIKTLKLLT